jgi:hypothetical protein
LPAYPVGILSEEKTAMEFLKIIAKPSGFSDQLRILGAVGFGYFYSLYT